MEHQRNLRYYLWHLTFFAFVFLSLPLLITFSFVRGENGGVPMPDDWTWPKVIFLDVLLVGGFLYYSVTSWFEFRTTFSEYGISQASFTKPSFLAWQDVESVVLENMRMIRGGRSDKLCLDAYRPEHRRNKFFFGLLRQSATIIGRHQAHFAVSSSTRFHAHSMLSIINLLYKYALQVLALHFSHSALRAIAKTV